MQLCYSPIAPEDVENILAMQKELIERYENLDAIDCQKVFAWCRRKIEAQMQDYRKILCDGVTAGYYALHRQEEEWELDDLYLYPAFQRKGIGTAVLQKVIADTAPAGLFLYVFVKNTGAVRLYERLGFVQVGFRPGYYQKPKEDALIMTKDYWHDRAFPEQVHGAEFLTPAQ